MDLKVTRLTTGCDTNEQGALLYDAVAEQLSLGGPVVVDFSGIPNVTSSFVNSSFVALIEDYGFDFFRNRVTLVGINRQIANMVRSRVQKQAA